MKPIVKPDPHEGAKIAMHDLLMAIGPAATAAVNTLPEKSRIALAHAIEAGSKVMLVATLGSPGRVSLVVSAPDGAVVELAACEVA